MTNPKWFSENYNNLDRICNEYTDPDLFMSLMKAMAEDEEFHIIVKNFSSSAEMIADAIINEFKFEYSYEKGLFDDIYNLYFDIDKSAAGWPEDYRLPGW